MILTPNPSRRVFAYPAPVDLRKGYDGLFGLVEQGLRREPMCGDLYIFVNFSTGREHNSLSASGWEPIGAYRSVAERSLRSTDYELLAHYHAKRTEGGGFPEFAYNPYTINLFELLAIERLTGVPIEDPKHELMRTPLFRHRDVPEIPIPPELAAVIERATLG